MTTQHQWSPPRPRWRSLRLATVGILTTAAFVLLAPAAPAAANGCGFLGLEACPPVPSTLPPGTRVPTLTQVNQSTNGGTNPKVGNVPSTKVIGTPDAGTVPIVGSAAARADDGAFVAYETRVDARTLDLMVYSPALKGAAPVRLLLPRGYASTSNVKYPSLYLINGGNDKADYQSWSLYSTIPQKTAAVNALVVMPSGGLDAFITNYFNYGIPNQGNQYDTFVTAEIPQLLQRGYRASTTQVIGGVSSGGYSAMAVPALHPGQWSAAASYSGLLNTSAFPISQIIQLGSIVEFRSPLAMWGSWLLNNGIWQAHDPTVIAARLKGVKLFVSAGNGTAGPLDPPSTDNDPIIEPVVLQASTAFVRQATAVGVPVQTDFYGSGTHSWPYWDREFSKSWGVLAAGLGVTAGLL